ncbi:nitroreductase family protein [Bifidobacterium simiarum]|uniref:nitroreductase family protein n=1 Tax=Bifidobacterium simiarum TaxID=2045441 RepID=UPI001BDBB9D6|nr:nitroreductase family protein [Bifidobacterium simiarum]MBT1166881.1 nitroreductase [Bifidobacterium simiarum]
MTADHQGTMTLIEAMKARHAVRKYLPRPIERDVADALNETIDACNRKSGLHLQLVLDEPRTFGGLVGRTSGFSNANNYLAVIGPDTDHLEFDAGYWGQHVVLRAQQLGLNSRWVAATYKKVPEAWRVDAGERLLLVIALGYGANPGRPHRSKSRDRVMKVSEGLTAPQWFLDGVDAALLAPTAMNQQAFTFTLADERTVRRAPGSGYGTNIDLGIASYQFELAAGTDNFDWAD